LYTNEPYWRYAKLVEKRLRVKSWNERGTKRVDIRYPQKRQDGRKERSRRSRCDARSLRRDRQATLGQQTSRHGE